MSRPNLKTLFDLEAPQSVSDGSGGADITYALKGQLWGEIKAMSGGESLNGEISVSKNRYRITFRGAPIGAPSRPTPRDRLVLGPRIFEITAVREADPSARFVICDATEERTL